MQRTAGTTTSLRAPEQQTDSEELTVPKFSMLWDVVASYLPQRTIHVPQKSECMSGSEWHRQRWDEEQRAIVWHHIRDGATAYTATLWLSTSSLPSLQRTSSSVRPREEGRIAELAFHTQTPCRKAGVGPEFHPSLTTTLTRREHKLPPRQAQLLRLSSFLLIAYLILGFYCCI